MHFDKFIETFKILANPSTEILLLSHPARLLLCRCGCKIGRQEVMSGVSLLIDTEVTVSGREGQVKQFDDHDGQTAEGCLTKSVQCFILDKVRGS